MKWRDQCLGALVGLLFWLPYMQWPWWQFFHTTIVLLCLWGLHFGKDGLTRLGLGIPTRHLLGVPVALGAVLLPAGLLQTSVADAEGLSWAWSLFPENVDTLFQALNEELLVGYLLLRGVSRRVRNPHALVWTVSVAFALLHVVFYRWLSMFQEWMSPASVLALLFVGLARNYLIVLSGHVGWAWALHAGWNLGFFGRDWGRGATPLTEPEMFAVFVGRPELLVATAILAAGAGALVFKRGAHPRLRADATP